MARAKTLDFRHYSSSSWTTPISVNTTEDLAGMWAVSGDIMPFLSGIRLTGAYSHSATSITVRVRHDPTGSTSATVGTVLISATLSAAAPYFGGTGPGGTFSAEVENLPTPISGTSFLKLTTQLVGSPAGEVWWPAFELFDALPPPPDPEADPTPVGWDIKTGSALVFDMRNPVQGRNPCDGIGQWYDWALPGERPVGACTHLGAVHLADETATPRVEVASQFYDDDDTQILTSITHAPWSIGGLGVQQIVHRGHLYGVNYGAATVQLSGNVGITEFADPVEWDALPIELETDGPGEFDFRPVPTRRGNSIEIALAETASDNLTEGLGYKGISLEVGLSGKLGHSKAGNRI